MQIDDLKNRYLIYVGDRARTSRELFHFMEAHGRYFRKIIYLCYGSKADEWDYPKYNFLIRVITGFRGGVAGVLRSFLDRRSIDAQISQLALEYPDPLVVWQQPSLFGLVAFDSLSNISDYVIPFVRGDVRKNITGKYPLSRFLGLGRIAEFLLKQKVGGFSFVMTAGSRLGCVYYGSVFTHNWRGTTHDSLVGRRAKKLGNRLLFVGRLDKNKRCCDAIKAVAILHEAGYAFILRIAGDGSERFRLERLVRRLGVGGAVEFLGNINDDARMLELYCSADMLILPSLSEGMSKVVPEAMSTGCLVIATPAGDLPYALTTGECKFVEFRDPDGIAEAVKQLHKDIDYAERMRKQAYKYAQENSLSGQVERLWENFCRHARECRRDI